MRVFLAALALSGFLLAGCDRGPEPVVAVTAPVAAVPPAAPAAPAAPSGQFKCCADERDTNVVRHYLEAQTALASDDYGAAAIAVTALAGPVKIDLALKLRHYQRSGVPTPAREEELAAVLHEVSDVQYAFDLAESRTAMKKLSAAVIPFARARVGGTLAVTEAYCPMADASWLQAGNTIANPYYGSAMLECGSFR